MGRNACGIPARGKRVYFGGEDGDVYTGLASRVYRDEGRERGGSTGGYLYGKHKHKHKHKASGSSRMGMGMGSASASGRERMCLEAEAEVVYGAFFVVLILDFDAWVVRLD